MSILGENNFRRFLVSNENGSFHMIMTLITITVPSRENYSNTCVKRTPSKRMKIVFQDQLSLNAGQKYCRILKGEHSAILLTFIN